MKHIVCKCGSTSFLENTRVSGWWERTITSDGIISETSLDKLNHGPHPKTVRCIDCNRVNPNPLIELLRDLL